MSNTAKPDAQSTSQALPQKSKIKNMVEYFDFLEQYWSLFPNPPPKPLPIKYHNIKI